MPAPSQQCPEGQSSVWGWLGAWTLMALFRACPVPKSLESQCMCGVGAVQKVLSAGRPPTPWTYTLPAQVSHPETPPLGSCSCSFCLCRGSSTQLPVQGRGRGGDESQEPWTHQGPESTPWPHCSKLRDLECVPCLPLGPRLLKCSGEPQLPAHSS